MNGLKKVFAVLFAVTAVVLMNTTVFALVDGVSSDYPHIVTTGKGLVDSAKNNMNYYIKLGSDIEINGETGYIEPVYLKHVDLDGHTIKVTNDQFIFMYTNGAATTKKFEMYNGNIEIDVPKKSSAPCMIDFNMGHIIMRDITMDITLRNDNGTVFYNESTSDSVSNSSIEFYNCTINDHSTVKTKVIKSRPMLVLKNTAVSCDNQNSYALVIMHRAKYFSMINCKLKGKIGFDVYNPKTMNVNDYIRDWQNDAARGGVAIGIDLGDRIQMVTFKENVDYGDYVAETYPIILNDFEDINVTCGDKLSVPVAYSHADTCEWFLATEFKGVYTPVPEDEYKQAVNISQSNAAYPDITSTLSVANAGGWLDGMWLCVTISDGIKYKTTKWAQININKRTISSLTMYLDPPTQGKPLDYTMSFDKATEQCVDSYSIGYYSNLANQTPYTYPQAGDTCYIAINIDLKSNYAEFKQGSDGEYTADLIWNGIDKSALKELIPLSVESDSIVALYSYTVPVPNNGAGDRVERVNTGIDGPVIGKKPSTAYWQTGNYVSRGYTIQNVSWTPSTDTFENGRYYTAVFTVKAKPGYFIDEQTEFYLNDTKVEPISIADSGTLGNTAEVSITFAKKADVNADGSIDNVDAALVLKHLGGTELLTGENLKCADMNEDGEYDIRDAIAILKNK